jgi:hypothetical protein
VPPNSKSPAQIAFSAAFNTLFGNRESSIVNGNREGAETQKNGGKECRSKRKMPAAMGRQALKIDC